MPRKALPALPNEPDTLIAQARSWLSELSADIDGITSARNGAAVLDAMRAAARKAGQSAELEAAYAEAARTAERRLGQLLTEGRTEGTVAKGRERTDLVDAPTQLRDLGVSRDLAADTVTFACLDDARWDDLIVEARSRGVWSRASFRTAADQVLAALRDAEGTADKAQRDADAQIAAITEKARKIIEKADKLTIAVPLEPPDLTVNLGDAGEALTKATESVTRLADTPKTPDQWHRVLAEANDIEMMAYRLMKSIDDMPAPSEAAFVPISVQASRRAVVMLGDALTAWIAAVNAADVPPATGNIRRIR